MGLFSALKSIGSAVWGGVKTVAKKSVEVIKDVGSAVWEGAKKAGAIVKAGWEKFTGRDKEREAEALLAAMEEKARTKEKDFEEFFDNVQKRIDSSIEEINSIRAELNLLDFRRFEELASNFSTWDVANIGLEFSKNLKKIELEPLKQRGELFKIDFRNNPIKSNLKAIVSVGFWSRKQAKESLLAVKEEEHRLDCELKKFDAEVVRLNLLAESLENVISFISSFRTYYKRILDELDYSVNFLRSSYFTQTQKEPPALLDPAMLPQRHQKCLECSDKATRIMYEIAKRHYISATQQSVEMIQEDFKCFNNDKAKLETMQQDFAA